MAMVEFLKYGKDVLYLAFKGAWAIATFVAFIISIIVGNKSNKKPQRETKLKKLHRQIKLIKIRTAQV